MSKKAKIIISSILFVLFGCMYVLQWNSKDNSIIYALVSLFGLIFLYKELNEKSNIK